MFLWQMKKYEKTLLHNSRCSFCLSKLTSSIVCNKKIIWCGLLENMRYNLLALRGTNVFVFSILRKTTKKPQQNKVVSSRCERDLTKVNCLRHFIHNNAWRVCRRVSLTPGTKSTEGISRLLGNKCRYPILDRSLAILLLFPRFYLISNVYDKHSLN